MRQNPHIGPLQAAIDDAWLGKVELDLAVAEQLVHTLSLLEMVAHYARNLQLGTDDSDRFGAAWNLTEALNRYYGTPTRSAQ